MTESPIGPVLVVESDEAIIKDIACSLRLIDIPVASALSVQEALRFARERAPSIILSRMKIEGDSAAAENLINAMSRDAEVSEIPVFALCTSSEEGALGELAARLKGVLTLPVEFPSFPEQVKRVMNLAPAGDPERPAEVALAKVERHDIPDHAPDGPIDVVVKDRNLTVAYAIQSRVLRELEADGRIYHARTEQVPGIVNQVTARVCVRYTEDKFL